MDQGPLPRYRWQPGQSASNIFILIVTILNNHSRCRFPCEINVRCSSLRLRHTLEVSNNNNDVFFLGAYAPFTVFLNLFFKPGPFLLSGLPGTWKQLVGTAFPSPSPAARAGLKTFTDLPTSQKAQENSPKAEGQKKKCQISTTFPEKLKHSDRKFSKIFP